ncbi:MAG: hypothetical protein IJO50_00005, partial [Clostridia bacterium]|nr:hypothetical protein [Clostridia bacterium]
MYCKYCGQATDDDSKFCSNCGNEISLTNGTDKLDKPSRAFAVLGFFIPIVGLILYAVYERKQPKRAKSAGKGALIGVITKIVVYIVAVVLYIIFASSLMTNIMGYIDTYDNVGFARETADYNIEFGEFDIASNGYGYETSLEVTVTNNSERQKSFFVTIEAVDEEGMRIDTDMVMADRLNPKQKMKLEA